MSKELCKKIINAVQTVICQNTIPSFDEDGKPVNVWEARPGYDEIKSVIEAQFTDAGEVSDGYHTFNELYHHRAVLFSVICNVYSDRAWKSKKHSDGTMYDGMFIVGINTPDGQATYHYNVVPYWDMFDVPELEFSPKWDGHTSDDAIERLTSLKTWRRVMPSNDVLTDKDIIKALRCCNDIRWCNHCPLYTIDFCKDKLSDAAIDLFDRLKAKNKELDEKNMLYKGLIDRQKAELEKLQDDILILSQKRTSTPERTYGSLKNKFINGSLR